MVKIGKSRGCTIRSLRGHRCSFEGRDEVELFLSQRSNSVEDRLDDGSIVLHGRRDIFQIQDQD